MKHPELSIGLLKKPVTGAVLLAVILSVTGCFGRNGTTGIKSHDSSTLKKIIKYLDDNDPDGLYELFSADKKSDESLMERLEAMCDFWDEEDLTVKKKRHTSGGGAYDHGKYTYYETRYYIYVESSDGEEYEIYVSDDYINNNEPEMVGINMIEIRNEDEDIVLTSYKDDDEDNILNTNIDDDPVIPDGEFTACQTDLDGEMIVTDGYYSYGFTCDTTLSVENIDCNRWSIYIVNRELDESEAEELRKSRPDLTDNGLIEVTEGQWVYVFYDVNYGVSTAPAADKLTLFWVEQ